jgi:hypothetical protein
VRRGKGRRRCVEVDGVGIVVVDVRRGLWGKMVIVVVSLLFGEFLVSLVPVAANGSLKLLEPSLDASAEEEGEHHSDENYCDYHL